MSAREIAALTERLVHLRDCLKNGSLTERLAASCLDLEILGLLKSIERIVEAMQ